MVKCHEEVKEAENHIIFTQKFEYSYQYLENKDYIMLEEIEEE